MKLIRLALKTYANAYAHFLRLSPTRTGIISKRTKPQIKHQVAPQKWEWFNIWWGLRYWDQTTEQDYSVLTEAAECQKQLARLSRGVNERRKMEPEISNF